MRSRSATTERIDRLHRELAIADQRIAELEAQLDPIVRDLEVEAVAVLALEAELDEIDAMASVDAPSPTAEGGQHVG